MTHEYRFIKACRREPVDCTPIWLMRQAGRYMAEYRAIREKTPFLTMCKTPELAAEVTLQPVNKLGVDAAIIFADILLPLEGMGIGFEFAANEGPVIHEPVRSREQVDKVRLIDPDTDTGYVMEAIRLVRAELEGKVPVIGFSGAPFTLASYIVEGGGSRNYRHIKSLAYNDPGAYHLLLDKIADVCILYLKAQIRAGAHAVQLFDSWAGAMGPDDYEEFVLPHTAKVLKGISGEVPVIHFAHGGSTLLELVKQAGGDVISVDWRIDLDEAWRTIGYEYAIQGNLDPVALFAPVEEIGKRAKGILDRAEGRPGHVFNLGHGILPETPVDHVKALVDVVHEYSSKA
ncbi:MAG: uroporphyrinogen decarboxylase [Actinobacteria bacterium]|nr:MAG: uroporphyrinogen decarboxylase [Actinomycetota bacterium]